jgi:hypothetical protein
MAGTCHLNPYIEFTFKVLSGRSTITTTLGILRQLALEPKTRQHMPPPSPELEVNSERMRAWDSCVLSLLIMMAT